MIHTKQHILVLITNLKLTFSLQFPCMSDSVSIKYNADAGRHGIAEQKINPGIPHNTIVTLMHFDLIESDQGDYLTPVQERWC